MDTGAREDSCHGTHILILVPCLQSFEIDSLYNVEHGIPVMTFTFSVLASFICLVVQFHH